MQVDQLINSLPDSQDCVLTCHTQKCFELLWEKEEYAGNHHFLLFPQCLLLFQNQFSQFGPVTVLSVIALSV